ncbi:MAG: hypothetical protein ACP6KW_09785 [Candidatus Thorarchaeota archaeon]
MKILDKLLSVFGRQRHTMLGAMAQPYDLMSQINAVRARAFLKITGKTLPLTQPTLGNSQPEESLKKLSPSRRLARKGL